MKVILLKDLKKLGKIGDTVKVKDGYGRNYLIPQGIALTAIEKNFKRAEEAKKIKAKLEDKKKKEFLEIKAKIEKISLTITAEAKDDEKLYGTISELQILKLLQAEGVELDKNTLVIDNPINKVGVYNLKVNLCPEVEATLRVWIVKNN